MLTAVATVPIDRPERWAKQLVSHFSHKCETEPRPDGTLIHFGAGDGLVAATAESVRLTALADTPQQLAEVQDVLERHFVRFAQRENPAVRWGEASSS